MYKFFSVTLFAVLISGLSSSAWAEPKQSLNMIFSHTYNIGNSIGGIANNFNIKETWIVDKNSICRHLGIIKGATDAIDSTLFWDKELKKAAAFSNFESSLAILRDHLKEATSFCGRDYAMEVTYNPKIEGDLDFIKTKAEQLSNDASKFSEEFRRVEQCLENDEASGSCH